MNRNSKMTVTFPLNRTGSFALHFFIGILTQVSIILIYNIIIYIHVCVCVCVLTLWDGKH